MEGLHPTHWIETTTSGFREYCLAHAKILDATYSSQCSQNRVQIDVGKR